MLKKLKNTFFEIISECGFSVDQFMAEDIVLDSVPTFIISFRNTKFKFLRKSHLNYNYLFFCYYVTFSPEFIPSKTFPENDYAYIEEIYRQFRNWLVNEVKEYVNDTITPDYWAELNDPEILKEFLFHSNEDFNDESFFDQNEIKLIRSMLEEVIEKVNNDPRFLENERSYIKIRLDDLSKSVEKLSKFNWKNQFIAVITGIVINLSIDTNSGKILIDYLKSAFLAIVPF